jgi:hypothetical protein
MHRLDDAAGAGSRHAAAAGIVRTTVRSLGWSNGSASRQASRTRTM